VPYVAVSQDARSLVLHLSQRSEIQPRLNERVTCVSVAGTWTTTVLACRDGAIELVVPDWLSRDAPRRWRRALVDHSISLSSNGEEWAGRLQDVSAGGAAVMVERRAAPREGDSVDVVLPVGVSRAVVCSVRPHAHPLLVVVGLSWRRLDPEAQSWIGAEMAASKR
jgi:hypothetical protein